MSLTIPNLLSVLRIALIPVFIVTMINGQAHWALAVFVAAGLTDMLDGAIARYFDQQSKLGSFLDPIADKLLLVSAFVLLTIPGLYPGVQIPLWVTGLVVTRDVVIVILVVILYIAFDLDSSKFAPTWLSKINTTVQIATIVLVLASGVAPAVEPAAWAAIYLTAATTLASGLDYLVRTNHLAAIARQGS